MRVQDGLKALRRLWPVIIACGLLASTVMWLITPIGINTERKVASFDAIATLLVSVRPIMSETPGVSGLDPNLALNRVGLLIRTGEIPHLAAQNLGYRGDPAVLASRVSVKAHSQSGSVTISMTSKDSRPAVETVNAFASAAVDYFEGPGSDLGVDVTLLEEATALPNETTDAYVAPPSKWGRTLIAGVVGLVLGVGLVLFVDRLDPRLRTRRQVAGALALPVFAEIPRRSRGRSRLREIALIDTPRSVEADAYRVLRSAILHARTESSSADASAYVIVVTSLAGGSDEALANVAAGLAQDHRVLAVDADLRNPGLEEWFDVPFSEGLSDYVADPSIELTTLARPTRIPGVQVLTAGGDTSQPVLAVSQIGKVLTAAERAADVIIVKSPPLLAGSDVFDLLPHANMVLVTVRSGRLDRGAAARAQELLHRFPHTDAGVVLLGAQEGLFGIGAKTRQMKDAKQK